MRNVCLLAALVATPWLSRAPSPDPALSLDPVTHRITLASVVAVPGAIQRQLHTRALSWLANDSDPQPFAAQLFDAEQG